MDQPYVIVALVLIGLCFGSFVNALVWRLHKKRDFVRERSECTHCHHVLAWYDLVPVLSYAWLRGRCRYCRRAIDDSPLVEVATAVLFVGSYLAWPFVPWTAASLTMCGLWLVAAVLMVALTVYDIRWQLLPDKLVFPLIAIGALIGAVRFYGVEGQGIIGTVLTMAGGVAVIAGLYAVLYYASAGRWVGFGDVKLNVFIGLILGWQGALLAVFVANLLGMVTIVPGLVLRRITPKSRIPFGPFLIAACAISLLWGQKIINWYLYGLLGIG